MPLRLLEVTVPHDALEEIPALIDAVPVVHVRLSGSPETSGLVNVLLEAHDAEAVSDLLVSRYGSSDGFRLILFPVEATLPGVVVPPEAEEVHEPDTEPPAARRERISREELYEDVVQASRLTITYVVMVSLSTLVAAVGLIRGDVAIIIGAMVIAPLLGPNVALSLATTLGDVELAKRSLKAVGAGVVTALVLSVLMGVVLWVDPSAPHIAARTQPAIGDIVLALAAGAAGTLAFTSGVPAVVVGVMVAVALLPPLVVAGLLAGAGYGAGAIGALVLLFTNVTCINLAAIATFFVQDVKPRTWWEADKARRSTVLALGAWIVLLGMLVALILLGRLMIVGIVSTL